MSFSSDVRAELLPVISPSAGGRRAELAAILRNELMPEEAEERRTAEGREYAFLLHSVSAEAARKGFTLLRKTAIIKKAASSARVEEASSGQLRYVLPESCMPEWNRFLGETVFAGTAAQGCGGEGGAFFPEALVRDEEARRSYLRGSFLCIGSMSDPGREYHLEFVCAEAAQAALLANLLAAESLRARTIVRRNSHVVYLKESEAISDLLTMMGAHGSVLVLEDLLVRKEIANRINRQVNCETSNLMKTITASQRQMADIQYLRDHGGFGALPEVLRQTAENRLRFPDATLLELGNMASPPVGKSGMNHRLRKLSEQAAELRKQNRD